MSRMRSYQDKTKENYQELEEGLKAAYERAALGKGKERHANDKGFMEQDIITEAEIFGIGPHMFQVRKKARELMGFKEPERQMNELLDIAVYAIAAYLIVKGEE